MSEHDDLRSIFRTVAEGADARPGAEEALLGAARRRRVVTTGVATLAMLTLIGGIAGASMMLGDRRATQPAPAPTLGGVLRQDDLAAMTVTELAAALFLDAELQEAVPSGFSVDRIVRHGPDVTNHDYATVGVQMEGPVPYARVIFFVHPDEATARLMYTSELQMAEARFADARRSDGFRGWQPYALEDALLGTSCGAGTDDLFSCHALRGRVVMLTESSAGGTRLGGRVSETQLDAAETLARSFGSYLREVYPAPDGEQVPAFGRYHFTIGGGFNRDGSPAEGTGMVEVDSKRGSVCVLSQILGATEAHLHPDGVGESITLFEPPRPYDSTLCTHGLPVTALGAIIADPTSYSIEFHNEGSGGTLSAQLELMSTPPAPEEGRADRYVDNADGVSVEVAKGWQVARRSLTPNLGDPREILSMGTAPMPPGGNCAQQPVRALDSVGPTDAFISIQERRGNAGHPLRPGSFRDELEDRFLNIELCTDATDFKPYWFAFSDAGRDFHLLAALGTEASAARTRQFWAILDSLEFFGSDVTEAVRATVTGFMRARVEGAGAEAFLGSEGWPERGPTGEPAALYPDRRLEGFRVEFVGDDLGAGSYEVGVSLIFEDGTAEETLFVRESDGGFVIVGARGGLEGP